MDVVNVLWTGGLDSSYRIVELSRMDVIIQPYYIYDRTRGSIKYELKAINKITQDIKNNEFTKATLLPIRIVNDYDILPNEKITLAWSIFHDKYGLGSQYDYLARFARQYNLKLEVGLESSNRSKAANTIKSEAKLFEYKDNNYRVYSIDSTRSSKEAIMLFENMLFPSTLWHMTKLEEIENFKKLGFASTIKKTWFCHRPILGFPCGHCNPCKDCLNEGLAFRVPIIGYILGSFRNQLYRIYALFKKLRAR